MKTLLPYLLKNRWGYLLLIILMIGQALTSALQPRFLGQAIDALNTHQAAQAKIQIAWFLALSVTSMLLALLVTHLASRQAWRAVNQLRRDQLRHFFLMHHQHQQHHHADLMETLDTDPNQLVQVFGTQFPNLIMQTATVVFLAAQLITQAPLPGLLFTGLTAALLASFSVSPKRLSRAWQDVRHNEAQVRAATFDVLNLRDALRILGTPRPASALLSRVRRVRQTLTNAHVKAISLNNLKFVLSDVLLLTGTLAIVLMLLSAYRQQAVTVGVIVMFLRSIVQMRDPVAIIAGESADLHALQASLQRISAHFAKTVGVETADADTGPTGKQEVRADAGQLDIQSLQYHLADRPLLQSINLSASPGQHILIVGPSGSGKTTLSRLIDGTLRPHSGAVLLGGQRAEHLNPWERRKQLWVASQQQPLIHDSLRENLRLYDTDVSDADIQAAIKSAELQGWMAALNVDLESVLTPERFSAGQRQIITLLSALIAARPITLLDEPSAHLTLSDQTLVNQIIRALKRRSTVIHITHTPGDQVDVDQIIDLGRSQPTALTAAR
ncbi:ABC transporter ATP-binding protein [Deinococcus psychrotolerans]|uniref:ABC transporter ATP-binding protein n=1 Tax=Deinococcus psychrotolerans TaxID=2489213 RepID=A0A3G8YNH7_9DEIO|nr:ABC transporter ATP-binding protein [Deinococcus psychrotolerans]AZI44174.1 ABC transporter ATP-binding protein [Deinococcus psychrotolerans]